MNKNISYNQIVAYLHGELDEEAGTILEKWIDASNENKAVFNEYKTIFEASGHDDAPDFDEETALQNVHKDIRFIEKPTIPLSPGNIVWIFAAASIAVIIGFFVLVNQKFQNAEQFQSITAKKQVQQIQLPDGSMGWLNKASTIKFPKSFTDSIRRVQLNGEAYFEVTPDSRRPFTVYANGSITKVLGTEFNIRARKSEETIIVTVKEGKVSMADSTSVNNLVLLEKGEKGIFDKKKSKIYEEKVTNANFVAWKTGILTFDETPIPEVLNTLSEYYDVSILIGDSSFRNEKLTIAFEKVQLNEAKKMLTWGLHAKFDTVNGNLVLKKK